MTFRLRLRAVLTVFALVGFVACGGDDPADPDPVQHTLTLTGSGTGNGTVTSAPAGITCTLTAGVAAGACSSTFDEGAAVVLTAVSAAGSSFVGWAGACTGAAACSVTMTADQTVDAQFDLLPARTVTVTASSTGAGTLTSAPGGIDCASTAGVTTGTCSSAFPGGFDVVLTATPEAGSSFQLWTGDCAGTGTCSLAMDADKTADAQFDIIIQRALTITGSGTGTGTVSSAPAGITCTSTAGVESGTCDTTFDDGTGVVLTATPEAGSRLVGWTGDCTGTGTCSLAMDADKTADAQFEVIPQHTLTITGSGAGTGTVTSAPAGITCTSTAAVESGACSTAYDEGTAVVLTAAAETGSSFVGWTGACTGTGTCSVTMSADMTADAQFDIVPTHTLSVTGSSTGTGTVTSAPAGITCTSTAAVASGACSTAYNEGTAVVLTAAAASGSSFIGWTGACTGTGTCSVTMSADMSANAQFDVIPQRTLTVTGSSTGTGTVTSVPAGISCTSTAGVGSGTCSMIVDDGTGVTLTATPAGGHTFEVWTNACTGTGTCGLTMDADKTANAQFDRTPPPANLIETWEAVSLTFTPTGGGARLYLHADGDRSRPPPGYRNRGRHVHGDCGCPYADSRCLPGGCGVVHNRRADAYSP